MNLYGLIGYPLGHSFSKKYFTDKFKKEAFAENSFDNYEMKDISELSELVKTTRNLKGLSVTIPHKQTVLAQLTWAEDIVKYIGACNCIKIRRGQLLGYNTDVIGFEKALMKSLKAHHTKALILGRGGGAKAVSFILDKLHIDYYFVERKSNPRDKRTISYDDLAGQDIGSHPLIINCTPLGMFPDVKRYPPIPYEAITNKHYLFDLTYNPPKSQFLLKGEKKGAVIQNGYNMLVYQAEESWRIWNED